MTQHDIHTELTNMAKALVKERILGTRKGFANRPNYYHSLRVHEKLAYRQAAPDVCLAGLLHDVIEDGGVTLKELQVIGFTNRTVELVRLCSHDIGVQDSIERWTLMVAKLIEARSEDAWRIKLIDLTDNLTESAGLKPENQNFMLEVKVPILLRLTVSYTALELYRTDLMDEVEKRRLRLVNPKRDKLDRFDEAFLDALNSVPRSEQY